ncbi:hypothetical protein BKA00_003292 [Actinomadura coerulea]|uniref:Uncharacterized protein n=1 Tax=Actinomadura coerulea TaxID=46159 RepID=A0A7X0KZE1_9ACTN|nr:hypothetical protein [Actinomadura coerulea]MBB6396378.1 hypothetical protein [Actinomadura coerulea]
MVEPGAFRTSSFAGGGNDAADAVDAALAGARKEFAAGEPTSRGADFA